MSRKSNKTSHVLNLLTNRTGLTTEELEQNASPGAEEHQNRTFALPKSSVEIHAEASAAGTESFIERPVMEKKEVSISDRIRLQLEALESQEAAARAGNA